MSDKLTLQLEQMERTYETYREDFARDGTITPAEAATLESVSTKLEALRQKIGEYNKTKGIAPGGTAKKKPKSAVTEGEASLVKQVPLGQLSWGGRFRGQLWGITDKNNAVVRGGGSGPLKDIAAMNNLGERALQAIAGLDALEKRWSSERDVVRKAALHGVGDLKKLEQALPAMRKRMKGDGDFFSDVDGYLIALEAAEAVVGKIRKAEKDFDKASHELQAAVLAQKVDETGKQVEGAEGELKQLQADIEEAKKIFGGVLETVIQVAKQDWEGLATKAISFLGEKTIEAHYEPQLKELKQKLAAAKSEMVRLKSSELVSRIEAARSGVESAAIALENAQGEFRTALGQLARKQSNAKNELKESSSTAIAGQMIAQRTKQLHSIATARATCGRYLGDSAGVSANMAKISHQYALVGSWLDGAAKADPAFSRETPYAKMLELSSRSNTVMLDRWRDWVDSVQGECRRALAWIDDQGAKGPMAPFDQAITLIKQGLSG